MKITARAPRKEYERRIAPRSLFRILLQKLLHQWARGCIPAFLRLRLYRAMGVAIGGDGFLGLPPPPGDPVPPPLGIGGDLANPPPAAGAVPRDGRRRDP